MFRLFEDLVDPFAPHAADDALPRRLWPFLLRYMRPFRGVFAVTALFVAAAQAALDPPRSPRQWAVLAAVALATTAVTYLMFENYLMVLLPRGTWTGW